jgi:hypothetical protein
MTDYIRDLRPAKWGSGLNLRSSNPDPPMSALGQEQTSGGQAAMSALPPKADMDQSGFDVRFVPKADISGPASSELGRGNYDRLKSRCNRDVGWFRRCA